MNNNDNMYLSFLQQGLTVVSGAITKLQGEAVAHALVNTFIDNLKAKGIAVDSAFTAAIWNTGVRTSATTGATAQQ